MPSTIRSPRIATGLSALIAMGCSGNNSTAATVTVDESAGLLTATVGPEGALVQARESAAFAGFAMVIPAGALAASTTLRVRRVEDETPLPTNAFRVGLQFRVEADGASLAQPIHVQLPVDGALRNGFGGNTDDVKVWARNAEGWSLVEPMRTSPSSVMIAMSTLTTMAAGVRLTFNGTVPSLCGGASLPCTRTEFVEPAVGHAPQPCTIAGGFCLEPLAGDMRTPFPSVPAAMVVGRGFVTYSAPSANTPPAAQRAIELRTNDLAVLHGQARPSVGSLFIDAMLPNGSMFIGQTFQRFLGIDNSAPAATSLQVSGQTMGLAWSALSATTARNYLAGNNPNAITMFDATTAGARTTLPSIALAHAAFFLGAEAGVPGSMWYVEATQSFSQQLNGVNSGVLHRINPDGTLGTSIQDTDPPSLLLVDQGGDGLAGGVSAPPVFTANARRMVLSRFIATNKPPRLSIVDLTAATPTLAPLNFAEPASTTIFDGVRAAVLDDHDRVWIVFGSTSRAELFVFDPATGETQGVPLVGFRPQQLGFDGTHVIVSAISSQPPSHSQIFRVRPFGA